MRDPEYTPPLRYQREARKKPDTIQLSKGASRKRLLRDTTPAATRYGLTSSEHLGMVASTINAVGGNMLELVASPSTIKRHRKSEQKEIAKSIKRNFIVKYESMKKVLHWDGKVTQFRDIEGQVYQDANAVVLSVPLSNDTAQFIGAPIVERGTGEKLARSAMHCVNEWEAQDDLVALVFDTTASNTGHHQGAGVYIEEQIGHAVMWPACRFHVAELHIKLPYDTVFGATTGPDDPLFKRFKDWYMKQIPAARANGARFPDSGLFAKWPWDDSSPTGPYKSDITWWMRATLTWVREQLERNTFPRGDYREFCEALNIILGGEVNLNILLI